jgi:peptidyl-prolyl cis-trans isomerase SurA
VQTRLNVLQKQIKSGTKSFEVAAKEFSEDSTATQGGDLGWVSPGALVPEFETTMNELPLNTVSEPIVSRFGVHLIEVLERREKQIDVQQQREQARNALREKKFESEVGVWLRELRALAYIELREAK